MIKPMAPSKTTQPFGPQQVHNDPPGRAAAATMPRQEDIARRAYEIYVRKGFRQGQCEQNWLEAEQEMKNHQAGDITVY